MQQNTIEKSISKTLRKSSPARAWGILLVCAGIVAFVVFLRFFVLSVWKFEGKYAFVCELALCKENSQEGDLVLARSHSGNLILLRQVGKSADQVKIPTPFDTLYMNIPKVGDTLVFENLNSMLWDASITLYKETFPEKKVETKIFLWSGEKEIPFSLVGKASISGRPVSEREVAFLPWHELRLLELQLQKIFPAADSIHFKRKLFEDTLEIKDFVVDEELFYLSCEKKDRQKQCYDSRERGFFRKSSVRGFSIL
ncbi:MAG: hypothetical protein LBH25_00680 [Fibromonadaceae bacterium]|nr:hypothetical protein [Fibromonadaceae bacterium]